MKTKPRDAAAAFTLLEIMLAVAILGIVGVAIFRFTDTTLTVTRIAVQNGENSQAVAGFTRLLQAQLDSLPTAGINAVVGGSIKVGEFPRDELTLVCQAPAALLSRRAPGAWRVQLALRGAADPARGNTLGLQRLGPAEDDTAVDVNKPAGPVLLTDAATRRQTAAMTDEWVPLLDHVAGFEVNYFNGRLNGWLPKWNDPNAVPDCLRVRLTFAAGGGNPLELVLRVPPRARPPALAPTAVQTNTPPGDDEE